jgi:dipeptidyl-peptidase-4
MSLKKLFSAVALLGVCAISGQSWSSTVAEAAGDPSPADYAAAAKLLMSKLQGLVRNESVQPHWIGDSGRFWYRRDGQNGQEFVVVTTKGAKTPAFDHEAIAQALHEAIGGQRSGTGLPDSLTDVQLSDDLMNLSGRLGEKTVDCDLKTLKCRLSEAPPATPEFLPSPDGRQALLARDNNLFVRDLRTGKERALTDDGAPTFAWAKEPFYLSFVKWKVAKAGPKSYPYKAYWSPDGRYVIAPRVDEREVGLYPFYFETVPADGSRRPVVHNASMPLPGDREATEIQYFVFDLKSGKRTAIQLPDGYPDLSWPGRWAPVLGWSQSRGQAFILERNTGWKSGAVFRVDLATGKVSKAVEESSETRLEFNTFWGPSNVRLIGDGAEVIWYSDRTGWGHLYLYDAQTGRLKYAITGGDWAVQDIVAMDEQRRDIYFTAAGREAGQDPYYRQLYRARLEDGGAKIVRLTEAPAEHQFELEKQWLGTGYRDPPPSSLIRPDAGVFVDTWSTVDRPPVSELRSTRDGRLIAKLEAADASRLFAAGWKAPVRERVKAADGSTDIYADYFAPQSLTAGSRYPVIDLAYNGASSLVTPRNFTGAYSYRAGPSALTRLGFAVVIVDGRGTAVRSRAFRDAGYPEFTQVGIDDHVAAIRQLAERHPEMDTERVGVHGNSWGGTFATQAIMTRPEFYKVAVSGAGGYDYAALENGYEPYLGLPVYADGSRYRGRPDETPANWDKVQVVDMVDGLQGHLLLTFSDMDEQQRLNQNTLLIDALIKANKPYDLIFVPNGDHAHLYSPYVMKRVWDYFIQHLRGATPVRDFRIEQSP